MNETSKLRNQVPEDVAELWAQLYDEALENVTTLKAQTAPKLTGKVIALAAFAVMVLFIAALAGGLATGWVARPTFVCDAAEGMCTPTATIQPTYTPYPTATAVPPTETPTPTLTPTPTQTPTPTPTPLPLGDLLAGCTIITKEGETPDFDFGVYQESLVDVDRTVRTLKPVEGLETTFVLSNTGQCRLIQAQILDLNDGITVVKDLPMLFNAGQSLKVDYAWPPLEAGQHTITLTLQFLKPDGAQYNIPGHEFVLVLNLTLQLDSDDDTVPDVDDCCPQTAGLPALRGCPDSDTDGFVERNDKACPALKTDLCPNAAQGAAGKDGCPDSDGDGVLDKDDCCPQTAGLPTLSGCPDNDGDGFPERNDKACPNLPVIDQDPGRCGKDNGKPICHTAYDKCTRKVEDGTNPDGSTKYKDEEYDCNPHEVCDPCP